VPRPFRLYAVRELPRIPTSAVHWFFWRLLRSRTTPYMLCFRKRLGEVRSAVSLAVLG
jgi:hypothetical protein